MLLKDELSDAKNVTFKVLCPIDLTDIKHKSVPVLDAEHGI